MCVFGVLNIIEEVYTPLASLVNVEGGDAGVVSYFTVIGFFSKGLGIWAEAMEIIWLVAAAIVEADACTSVSR